MTQAAQVTPPLSRLCIHTATTRQLPLVDAVREYARIGAGGVTVWRDAVAAVGGATVAKKMITDSGLEVVSLCRGGFFVASTAAGRQAAIDDNRRVIDEAAELGADLIVLVCGAGGREVGLAEARGQIADGIAAVLPHAAAAGDRGGIRLAIEPLHPMYADSRSAVNTLRQANDLAERIGSPRVGIAVDVYHTWWDDGFEAEVMRAGRSGRLMAFHTCDFRSPTRDLLNDRVLPGEGVIPTRPLRHIVERAGWAGWIEVEVFSTEYWAMDGRAWVDRLKRAYLQSA